MRDWRNQCCLYFQRKVEACYRGCAPEMGYVSAGLLASSLFSWGRGEVSYEDDATACIDMPSTLLFLCSSPLNPSSIPLERPSSRTQGPVSAAGGGG